MLTTDYQYPFKTEKPSSFFIDLLLVNLADNAAPIKHTALLSAFIH